MIAGTVQSLVFIPSIPLITNILTQVYDDPDLQTQLTDLSSSLFILGVFLGLFLSNIVGGYLYDFYGGSSIDNFDLEKSAFYYTSLTIGAFIFIVLLIYMIFGDGLVGLKKTIL